MTDHYLKTYATHCACLQSEAKIHVNRVRPKWIKWEREYEDDEVSYPIQSIFYVFVLCLLHLHTR